MRTAQSSESQNIQSICFYFGSFIREPSFLLRHTIYLGSVLIASMEPLHIFIFSCVTAVRFFPAAIVLVQLNESASRPAAECSLSSSSYLSPSNLLVSFFCLLQLDSQRLCCFCFCQGTECDLCSDRNSSRKHLGLF